MNKTGFGLLHPPVKGGMDSTDVDLELLTKMVDLFMERGGRFFDVAYTYLDGAAEVALRECLVKRYPRESYFLVNKLPGWEATSEADNERFYNESLERCGVDRFDAYLVHWINTENYEIAKKFHQFEFVRSLKEEGKVDQIGFSFHDTAEVLEQVLSEHPEADYVTLQVNYLDWENEAIQARRCLEVCAAHGKPVVSMESIKGGTLINLPQEARAILAEADPNLTPAQWALRFVLSLDQVQVSLSGMSALSHVEENMADLEPLSKEEYAALGRVRDIVLSQTTVPCTGCGYCMPHCPMEIPIPRYFSLLNEYARNVEDEWKVTPVYAALASETCPASECLGCRNCEGNCPQRIEISERLSEVVKALEK